MWSKSKESANRLRQIPPNTQILNTEIILMVRIVGITIIVLLCTSVRCPSHIGISELFTLVRTIIILFCTIHWNIYWTGQRYMENINITKIWNCEITQRERRASPPLLLCIPFSRLCRRVVWMYEIFPVKRRTPRTSMNDQIIRTDLLSGILVVDTGGRVQNMEIMLIIIILDLFIHILKPSLVQIYQG